jgi:hypothetical protein
VRLPRWALHVVAAVARGGGGGGPPPPRPPGGAPARLYILRFAGQGLNAAGNVEP